jgi:hypothetical protein
VMLIFTDLSDLMSYKLRYRLYLLYLREAVLKTLNKVVLVVSSECKLLICVRVRKQFVRI